MKGLKKLLLLSSVILCVGFNLNAQLVKYDSLQTTDGVEFSYRWVREKRLDKNSSQALSLSVLNTNTYKVKVSFALDYYWKVNHVGESEIREFCLFPNERFVGRIDNLVYSINGYTDTEMKSEDFSWNLPD